MPPTALKSEKITEKAEKIKKIAFSVIFFIGFTCKYTNLVYFNSVDSKEHTKQTKNKRTRKMKELQDKMMKLVEMLDLAGALKSFGNKQSK